MNEDLKKLGAELTELSDKMEAIVQKAKDEERSMTAEEREEFDKHEAKWDELTPKFEEAVADQKRVDKLADRRKLLDAHNTGRRTQPQQPGKLADVKVVKHLQEDDPKKGFANPREFLNTIIDVELRPDKMDERLHMLVADPRKNRQLAAGSDEAGGYSDPFGGFLLPEGFSPELLKIDPEGDIVAGHTTNIPMAQSIVKIPARVDKNHSTSVSGGLTVGRRGETSAPSATRMELSQVTLHAHSLFGLSYATEELLSDSPISFAAILSAGFSDEFNSAIMDERINGTGVGEYLGILNSGCKIEVSAEGSQTADTVVLNNVAKMASRCYRYATQGMWLINHDVLPQLIILETANGGAVWQQALTEGLAPRLLGRPVAVTEHAKKVGDAGDIICCNWSQFLEGQMQPLQSAESMHVRFVNHERVFKFWVRNAGVPWWDAALTPKNGATQSPFVTLANRT